MSRHCHLDESLDSIMKTPRRRVREPGRRVVAPTSNKDRIASHDGFEFLANKPRREASLMDTGPHPRGRGSPVGDRV
jgi:hypothetical protein